MSQQPERGHGVGRREDGGARDRVQRLGGGN